jgi:hypothetical protein
MTGYKRLTEGGWEAFALRLLLWGFCLRFSLLGLAFGFWLFDGEGVLAFGFWDEGRAFGRENELLKGKCWRKIAEGKMN